MTRPNAIVLVDHRLLDDGAHSQNGCLGGIDDGLEAVNAPGAEV